MNEPETWLPWREHLRSPYTPCSPSLPCLTYADLASGNFSASSGNTLISQFLQSGAFPQYLAQPGFKALVINCQHEQIISTYHDNKNSILKRFDERFITSTSGKGVPIRSVEQSHGVIITISALDVRKNVDIVLACPAVNHRCSHWHFFGTNKNPCLFPYNVGELERCD